MVNKTSQVSLRFFYQYLWITDDILVISVVESTFHLEYLVPLKRVPYSFELNYLIPLKKNLLYINNCTNLYT